MPFIVTDIAIGAPYEDNGAGALYIYNGYSGGVWEVFSQRIQAKDVDVGLKAFGAALSLRPLYQTNCEHSFFNFVPLVQEYTINMSLNLISTL